MYQDDFCKLISGRSTGASAALLRFFLGVASRIYTSIISLRNFLYSKGWLKTYKVKAAVISIGNITTGGTGKTPLVIWLYNLLREQNIDCAVLTRGYKSIKNQRRDTRYEIRDTLMDEPAILTESCPNAKVIINPDRVEAAAEAVNNFGANVLVMDDGFQHRRLHRDLDIVAIDSTQPFGYGKMLPAGLLREPVASLKRANATVLTRCDQITETQLTQLENRLQLINPDMIIARSIHAPICAKSIAGEEISIEELKDKRVFAFCGLGNPDAFLNTIKNTGANLAGSKTYNDHYHYTENCLADIYEQAKHSKTDLILTTQKDWTKITPLSLPRKDIIFAYLPIELKFIAGKDKLKQLIEDTLAGKIHKN